MAVLALDFGSATGWAVNGAGQMHSGVWQIAPRRGESPGMRYIRLRRQLNELLAAYPNIGILFYEQAHHRGGAATEYAAGCVATAQAWCAEHRIEHASVHSATIKRHATGKGNANKDAVLGAVRGWGYAPVDDNEADALALLHWAIAQERSA